MAVQSEWEWSYQVVLLDASNLPTVHQRRRIHDALRKLSTVFSKVVDIQTDPFCLLYVNGEVVGSSKVAVGGGTSPTWNSPCNIRVHDGVASLRDAQILVYIAHLDKKKKWHHRPIGTAEIPLSAFPQSNSGPGVPGEWEQKELKVTAADGASPGEALATISVKVLKQWNKVKAAANTSTTAALIASSSRREDEKSKALAGAARVAWGLMKVVRFFL